MSKLDEFRRIAAGASQHEQYAKAGLVDWRASGQLSIIGEQVTRSIWMSLDERFESLLNISEADIQRGDTDAKTLGVFSDYFPNLSSPQQADELIASYEGDLHGGATKVFIGCGGKELPIEATPFSPTSISGLVECFFIAFGLPTKGIFWHGYYGKDYRLAFNDTQC
jgi:hypothetical protein